MCATRISTRADKQVPTRKATGGQAAKAPRRLLPPRMPTGFIVPTTPAALHNPIQRKAHSPPLRHTGTGIHPGLKANPLEVASSSAFSIDCAEVYHDSSGIDFVNSR